MKKCNHFCLRIIFSITQSSRMMVILTAAPSSVSKSFWFPGKRTKICFQCPEGSSFFCCLNYLQFGVWKEGMPHVGALNIPNGSLPPRAPLPSVGYVLAFLSCWLCSFPVKTSSAELQYCMNIYASYYGCCVAHTAERKPSSQFCALWRAEPGPRVKDFQFSFLNEYHVASFQIWQKCSLHREMQSGSSRTDERHFPKLLGNHC